MSRWWNLIAKPTRWPPVSPNLNPRDLSGRREERTKKKVALGFRKKGEAGPISIGNRGAADK